MKKRNIIFITLCLLISIVTCSYGTSVSKYMSNEDVSAFYTLQFKNVGFKGDFGERITSSYADGCDYDTLVVTLNIPRGEDWEADYDINEVYGMTTPISSVEDATCSVTLADNTYTSASASNNDYIHATVTCTGIPYKQPFSFNYSVLEQFNVQTPKQEKVFNYIPSFTYTLDVANYFRRYPMEIESDANHITIQKDIDADTSVLQVLSTWISSKVYPNDTELTETMVRSYLNRNGIDANTLVGDLSTVSVPGLVITDDEIADSDLKSYTINPQSLLANYIKTDAHSGSARDPKIFYFDGVTGDTQINDLFYYYLDKYMYSEGSVEYNAVQTYMINKWNTGFYGNNVLSVISNVNLNSLEYNNVTGTLIVRSNLYNTVRIIDDCDENPIEFPKISVNSSRTLLRTLTSVNTNLFTRTIQTAMVNDTVFNASFEYVNEEYTKIIKTGYFYFYDSDASIYMLLKTYKTSDEDVNLKFGYSVLIPEEELTLTYDSNDYTNVYSSILGDLNSIAGMYNATGIIDTTTSLPITTLSAGYYFTNIGYVEINDTNGNIEVKVQLAALPVTSSEPDPSSDPQNEPNNGPQNEPSSDTQSDPSNEPSSEPSIQSIEDDQGGVELASQQFAFSNYFGNYNNYFEEIKEKELN